MDNQPKEKHSAVELGALLRKARETAGLTLKDIYNATKIQTRYVEAMEAGELDKLPSGPFGRGFIKQYCELLHLENAWEEYKTFFDVTRVPVSIPENEDSKNKSVFSDERVIVRKKSRTIAIIAIVACIVLAVFVTFTFRGEISHEATNPIDGGTEPIAEEQREATSVDLGWMDGKPVKEQEPEQPQAEQPKEEQAEQSPAQASADTALSGDKTSKDLAVANATASVDAQQQTETGEATTVKGSHVLRISPKAIVWIKASVGSRTLYQGLVKPGEVKEFSPEETSPLRVIYGNAPKMMFSWNGSAEAPVGTGAKKKATKYYWSDGRVTDKKQ